ncbi:MAG: hypothetical protein QOJ57_861 [Thermoleophilaceae bacterium]|nr:hypothetical protein [Thermoleophilaceae bacterium]
MGVNGVPADAVAAAVLGARGRAPTLARLAAMARAEAAANGAPHPRDDGLGEAASALVEKVARHAYRITGEDIAAAAAEGLSDDELFDLVVAAALGAGLTRRTAGLAAVARWEEAQR